MERQELDGVQIEYNAIRAELVQTLSAKDQFVIAMYTLSLTILGLIYTLNNLELIYLEFIVLIIFQTYLNTKTMKIAKIGAYIKVNIEPKIQGMKWEHINKMIDAEYRKQHMLSLGSKEVLRLIRRHGSFILSVISLITYIFFSIKISNGNISLGVNEGIQIIICCMCVVFILILNIEGTQFYTVFDRYERILLELNDRESK